MRRSVVLLNGVDATRDATIPRPWLPLSLLTIASYLQANGVQAVLIDPQIHADWEDRLRAAVAGASYFGVTSMTGPSVGVALDAIAVAREVAPALPVVWGGYHATLTHRAMVREGVADVAVVGPGERAALALAHAFAGGNRALAEINGIAYRGSDGHVAVTARPPPQDMNELPTWDYTLLDPPAYFNHVDRVVPYVSSYGCPHACSYCAEPAHSARRFHALDATRVAREVLALADRYAPDLVDFMDPNFSTDPRRVVRFIEAIEELGGAARFTCNMRARDVVMLRRHIPLERLEAAGFRRIFIGVESGSDRMLTELRKNATVAHTVEACEALSAAGVGTYTSFMHDLPTETRAESEASLVLAEQLAALPGNLQAHQFYMPFPGTELFASRFVDRMDADAPQRAWASASTKGAPQLWPGRPEFRRRVAERLALLRDARPGVFELTRLPEIGPDA